MEDINQVIAELEFCSAQIYKAETAEELLKLKAQLLILNDTLTEMEKTCLQSSKQ